MHLDEYVKQAGVCSETKLSTVHLGFAAPVYQVVGGREARVKNKKKQKIRAYVTPFEVTTAQKKKM